jgi:hypothetical protein
VVCSLTHDELRPLFQVCQALRTTVGARCGGAGGSQAFCVRSLSCQNSSHLTFPPCCSHAKSPCLQLRNAVAYHFNYSTPSRQAEGQLPPALGERQRRPARTNVHQVISRLSRGARAVSG